MDLKISHTRLNGIYLLLAVLSATGVVLSFPPAELHLLGWFALAPFLFVLRKQKLLFATGLSMIFGLFYAVGSFMWVITVFETTPSKILIYLSFGLYYMIFGMAYNIVSRAAGRWITVTGPALWVGIEVLRSNLAFLSLPWNLLPHSQYTWLPIIQIADITGIYGITFLMVLVNQLLSEAMERIPGLNTPLDPAEQKKTLKMLMLKSAVTGTMVLVVLGYGIYKLSLPAPEETIRIAIVQPNRVVRPNMSQKDQFEHMMAYEAITSEAARERPSLIVWPASSLPRSPDVSSGIDYAIKKIAKESRSYLLVGGAGYDKFNPDKKGSMQYANVEFLVSPKGYIADRYNKMRLVPFDEYLPLRGVVPWPGWLTRLTTDFKRGEEYTVFDVSGVHFGALICWENMYPPFFSRFVRDGARFMVSATNEAFYGRTSAPQQTLAANIFRAVENRVEVVRAATTGVSAFVDQTGRIVDRVTDSNGEDLFVSGYLIRDVHLADSLTLYTKYGDVFGIANGMIAILITALSAVTLIRRGR